MNMPENPFDENSQDTMYVLLNKTDFIRDIFNGIYFDTSCNQCFNDYALFKRQFESLHKMKYVMDVDLSKCVSRISIEQMKSHVMMKVRNPFVREVALKNVEFLAVPLCNAILSPIDYVVDKMCFSARCYSRMVALSDSDLSAYLENSIQYACSTIGIDFKPSIKAKEYKEFKL